MINDSWSASPSKAKYWCDLADNENIRDDHVLSLRLKMLNKDKKSDSKPVEDMILKEITARPSDVGLRIRLVKFLLEEKRVGEAFKYCFDLEMKFMEIFLLSIDWYTTVASVLAQHNTHDTWNYWCLLLISIERQIFLNLKKDLSLQAIKQNNIKEVTNLIYEFDQVLKKAADSLVVLAPVKELADELLIHFRGQLALHIASLLFQKQKITNNDQWRETTKKCLPFLLFAFQSSTVATDAFWLKNTNETIRHLFSYLKKEGSFRCAQAARTILACKSSEVDIAAQLRSYKTWTTIDDIFNQIREQCADLNWRKNIYRVLFANADQQSKISTSYLVQNSFFQEPNYEIISFNDVDNYENLAQLLYPSSLEHHVYLGMGRKELYTYKTNTFSNLNLSTSNLINCNPETINRIDIDSFLYCAVVQAKRRLEAEKTCYESYSSKPAEKPLILPASIMMEGLCTEEQNDWWLAAFKIYKNISGDSMAQLKATLQFGIEAVRGIDSPKIDTIILLKLGDILLARAGSTDKNDERRHYELRAEYVYKFALKMMRNRESDNMRRIFKFTTTNFDVDREVDLLAGNAIAHLSGIYFKREEYKEFIEDFVGLNNAWAHYFRAEAYKKLDEDNNGIPKKTRKLYAEKARESLMETLTLLDGNENADKNTPLRVRVEKELRRLQYNLSSSFNDELDFHNTSQNGFETENDTSFKSAVSYRGRRDVQANASWPSSDKINELETLIKKLGETTITTKDNVASARSDIAELKEEVLNIRGDISDLNINKDATTAKALSDVYKAIEDLSWNVTYIMNLGANPAAAGGSQAGRFPQNPMQAQFNQMYNTAYPMYMQSMQYPTNPMFQRPGPQLPNMPFADPLGAASLLMNPPPNFNNAPPMIPSPQVTNIVPQQPLPTQPQQQHQQQQQQQAAIGTPKSSLLEALSTPSVLNTWNNTYNMSMPQMTPPVQAIPTPIVTSTATTTPIQNKPVEKAPPVNVVITSSDPLPSQNSFVSQPTLSVTIPPQHIKHPPVPVQQMPLFSSLPPNKTPLYENISPSKNDSDYLEEPADYDPRPDFKAIIPLPDEIVVKTGEENEEILFEERCKLFRFVDKEWKERGIGNIKILKNKDTKKCRIVMRREQIHKLCANHSIAPEMTIKVASKPVQVVWGANDFSEEEMKLEKFLARFKTPEHASKFVEIFEDVKKFAVSSPAIAAVPTKAPLKSKDENVKVREEQEGFKRLQTLTNSFSQVKTPAPFASPNVVAPTSTMTSNNTPKTFAFGGLTGALVTSSPIFGAPETKAKEKETPDKSAAAAAAATDKPSPFANFSFGGSQAPNKSFSELFGTISTTATTSSPAVPPQSAPVDLSQNNDDDTAENFEPTVQFEPVIPLPALIDVKTGEEDENVEFVHRAKLLRFDPETKEWKERGIGEMKVLSHKTDVSMSRLLMRREQVLKLCCNMVITKELKFSNLNTTTLSFGGQDFSENEMRKEMLAVRFKTAELVQSFHEAVKNVQKKLQNIVGGAVATKEPEKKKEEEKGFGDKFKPKVGSWNCEGCYISNKPDVLYCVACDSPKDSTVPKKAAKSLLEPSADAPKFNFGMSAATGAIGSSGFSFGSPAAAPMVAPVAAPPAKDKKEEAKGFGDKFKPKMGSWNCDGCYISNKPDVLYCVACDSPKDSTVPKKEAKSLLEVSADAPKFSFGMPGAGGFAFGAAPAVPAAPAAPAAAETVTSTTAPASNFSFGGAKELSNFTFGAAQKPADSTTTAPAPGNGFSFGAPTSNFSFGANAAKEIEKTPEPVIAVGEEGKEKAFNFVFKKKSPAKIKSPGKSRNDSVDSEGAAEADDNDYHEEEENQSYFTPVIPLPDKIEIKTGEEGEETLYSHRAKLYRFDTETKEWKERGVGDIKILKHRETAKLR